jgi:hypothetical protein
MIRLADAVAGFYSELLLFATFKVLSLCTAPGKTQLIIRPIYAFKMALQTDTTKYALLCSPATAEADRSRFRVAEHSCTKDNTTYNGCSQCNARPVRQSYPNDVTKCVAGSVP